VAEGIAADGSLLLRTPQGLRPVISGDVSVRPIDMALPTARR
jgi:BirA family biotin operon repressor/biotin-[acetyl-CoA-carboxylase] ligase